MQYCDWLTGKLKVSDHFEGSDTSAIRALLQQGGRITLPSEAEWERAARGPHPNPLPEGEGVGRDRIFTWPDDQPDPNKANYDDTGIGNVSPVGCFPLGQSPHGCDDMLGNVWEVRHEVA